MEDTGTLTALGRLGALGLADPERVLVLRTVSNYSMPPRGARCGLEQHGPLPDQPASWRRPSASGLRR